ncbi:MAG TPA: biotin/lipoate A/B protein ligase family protein [Methylomirabilota bacterium]|nr:biotin/lipoate A/B protein ligase family protein [Methylomirabilota bacterium]
MRFRLLVTEPLDGAMNMAIDETLLESRLADTAPPTLRFFGWDPATVSLGYGQPLDARIDVAAAAALGVGLVRRPTGGSAILHEGPDLELTYSVTARAGDFEGAADLLQTYRWIGAALATGLRGLAAPVEMVPVQPSDPATMPAFCFARTGSYELEVNGLKVVGSAQRRQGTGFLQHGAVMLGAAPDRLRRVFPGPRDPLAGMTTLEAVLGRRPGFEETMRALADGFRREHGIELVPGGLTGAEVARAEALVREKYGTERWTRAGRAMIARAVAVPGRLEREGGR